MISHNSSKAKRRKYIQDLAYTANVLLAEATMVECSKLD
jgi:hypothetical protein